MRCIRVVVNAASLCPLTPLLLVVVALELVGNTSAVIDDCSTCTAQGKATALTKRDADVRPMHHSCVNSSFIPEEIDSDGGEEEGKVEEGETP